MQPEEILLLMLEYCYLHNISFNYSTGEERNRIIYKKRPEKSVYVNISDIEDKKALKILLENEFEQLKKFFETDVSHKFRE